MESSKVNRSTEELIAKIPNIKSYGVTECEFILTRKGGSRSLVPSPSDISIQLLGSVTLDEPGWTTIRSNHDWSPISRNQVPLELHSILPNGDIWVSIGFNETFSDNPTFAHGFVIISNAVERKLFFLARDIDHPIR